MDVIVAIRRGVTVERLPVRLLLRGPGSRARPSSGGGTDASPAQRTTPLPPIVDHLLAHRRHERSGLGLLFVVVVAVGFVGGG